MSHPYANGARALDHVPFRSPAACTGCRAPKAGKSTAKRPFATQQTPAEGTIRFGGIDEPERRRLTRGSSPPRLRRAFRLDMPYHMAVVKGIASAGERRTTVETPLRFEPDGYLAGRGTTAEEPPLVRASGDGPL
jgi:hypothetical protein